MTSRELAQSILEKNCPNDAHASDPYWNNICIQSITEKIDDFLCDQLKEERKKVITIFDKYASLDIHARNTSYRNAIIYITDDLRDELKALDIQEDECGV